MFIHPQGRAPYTLGPDERAHFFETMNFALISELVEASNEIGWKPWATSRHLNRYEYIGELVDAWHFLMNLFLLAGATEYEIYTRYFEKQKVNIDRQLKGYDGVSSRCAFCHRNIAEVQGGVMETKDTNHPEISWCSPVCADNWVAQREVKNN
jgi:hypothetical protein